MEGVVEDVGLCWLNWNCLWSMVNLGSNRRERNEPIRVTQACGKECTEHKASHDVCRVCVSARFCFLKPADANAHEIFFLKFPPSRAHGY